MLTLIPDYINQVHREGVLEWKFLAHQLEEGHPSCPKVNLSLITSLPEYFWGTVMKITRQRHHPKKFHLTTTGFTVDETFGHSEVDDFYIPRSEIFYAVIYTLDQ